MQKQLIKKLVKSKLGLNVKTITDMKKGYNGKIYLIKTNKKALILKFQKKNYHRLIGEVQILEEFNRLRIPAPKVLITDFRHHFIIEEKIDGVTLKDAKLSTKQRRYILKAIGVYLKKIHKVKTKGFGYFSKNLVGGSKTWNGYLHSGSDFIRLKNKGIIPNEFLLKIEKFYKRNANLNNNILGFNRPKLLHGDVRFENIIVRNGKINGIIDAGEAISGDPTQDLASIYNEFKNQDKWYTPRLIEDFEIAYGRINKKRLRLYLLNLLMWDLRFFGIIEKDKKEFNKTLDKVDKLINSG